MNNFQIHYWITKWNEAFQKVPRTDGHPLKSLFLVQWNGAFQKYRGQMDIPQIH